MTRAEVWLAVRDVIAAELDRDVTSELRDSSPLRTVGKRDVVARLLAALGQRFMLDLPQNRYKTFGELVNAIGRTLRSIARNRIW